MPFRMALAFDCNGTQKFLSENVVDIHNYGALDGHGCLGLNGQRIGEATHPGPMEFLTIGTTNPGGMRNKEPLAVEQGCGIWSYAETQLSKVTQVSAAKALKFHASQTGISEYTMGHQLRSDHGPHGPARGQVWLAPVISRPNVFKFHGQTSFGLQDEFWRHSIMLAIMWLQ